MPCCTPSKVGSEEKTTAHGKAGIPGDPVLQDPGLHPVCRADCFDLSKDRKQLTCFQSHLADALPDQPCLSQML